MKRIVTDPQKSDMGLGFGIWEFDKPTSLIEFLDYIKKNHKAWGEIVIKESDGSILRRFDYDTYNNNILYTHLNVWQEKAEIEKVRFNYCFMNEDIDIKLKI